MKVLVTGGAGFIGSHLSERLVSSGSRVTVVDAMTDYYRPEQKRHNLKNLRKFKNFKLVKADIKNVNKLQEVFKQVKPDVIVHLASEVGVRSSFERTIDYIDTNVEGTLNVLTAMKSSGAKRLIFGSSSSVYGKRSTKASFSEEDSLSPISPYAATKRSAELLCQVYALSFGIKTTILRFFTVFGPRNRPDMACYTFTDSIAKNRRIKVFGHGVKRDFTFVDDVVDAIETAIKRPVSFDIFNIGGSRPVSVMQLVKQIEKEVGKKAMLSKVRLPQGDMQMTYANTKKAQKLLGWKPKTRFKQGIKQLVAWYKDVNNL